MATGSPQGLTNAPRPVPPAPAPRGPGRCPGPRARPDERGVLRKARPRRRVRRGHPVLRGPLAPGGGRVLVVQQGVPQQVLGPGDAVVRVHQRARRHQHEFAPRDVFGHHAGPAVRPVADGRVHAGRHAVGGLQVAAEAQGDLAALLAKGRQPGDQPLGEEGGHAGQREQPRARIARPGLEGGRLDGAQPARHLLPIHVALGRELHAAPAFLQQRPADEGLQPGHLLADRAHRDAQRLRGQREAFIPRHGIEGQQLLDGGAGALHAAPWATPRPAMQPARMTRM